MADYESLMRQACDLAFRGEGYVEPNPMVGCVVLDADGSVVGKGFHQQFGGPHAEVHALQAAGAKARGGTLLITLEPCCHTGKTPPCTRAIREAGIAKVVVATRDPFPQVAGGGIRELEAAGIECIVGIGEQAALDLLAPYLKLVTTGFPWVIAKWAMTLDGKLAATGGDSQWISGEASRGVVHRLRGRVDAIVVGARTAEHDDPLLTARPPGPRVATRVVWGEVAPTSQLATTIGEAPLLVATSHCENPHRYDWLVEQGGETLWLTPERCPDRASQLEFLLAELGRRRMTNIFVEGGAGLLGTLFDANLIDEVHAFVAAKIVGGREAISPIGGRGLSLMSEAVPLVGGNWRTLDGDLYFTGRLPGRPA